MHAAPERLKAQQYAFAAHLRDPQAHPAPSGLEDRRLQIYRELFFGNVANLLAGNFPVIERLLRGERWTTLVRDFYREHRCHTPLFPELGREFLRYLETRTERDPPWNSTSEDALSRTRCTRTISPATFVSITSTI